MKLITRILLTAFALLAASYLLSGIVIDNLETAIIAALVLGLINIFVRPVLFVLTLPVTIVTLGLFMFVINAGLLLMAANFVGGFSIDGFWSALLGSLIISVVSSMGSKFID